MSQAQGKQELHPLLTKAEKHLNRMFIAGCIFGALACFGRADYNLPLYAFLIIMFDQDDVSDAKLTLTLVRKHCICNRIGAPSISLSLVRGVSCSRTVEWI